MVGCAAAAAPDKWLCRGAPLTHTAKLRNPTLQLVRLCHVIPGRVRGARTRNPYYHAATTGETRNAARPE